MENNAINHGSASNHDISQNMSGMRGFTSNEGEGEGDSQESYNSTAEVIPQTASSNNSQATDGPDTISTPQTSSSSEALSSQGSNHDASASSQLSQLSQLAASQDPMVGNAATRPDIAMPLTAGQKRTADGQVKPPSPPTTYGSRNHGHSRNTSAVSNVSSTNSRIGELSAELRTRLSYAMVKVNNGWQSNTIEEVESLASLTGSPASSSSTLHGRRNVAASPRAAMIAMQRPANNPIHSLGGDFDLFSRTESASRTYESFWRDHSTNNGTSSHRPYATSPPTSKASLAPPADIRPSTTNSRRSRTPKFPKQPPSMPTHHSSHNSHSTPRTPTEPDVRERQRERVHTTTTTTATATATSPSQKTIQEQDAIETLLFMSSPGNSGTAAAMGPFAAARATALLGSPQRSPLRAEFRRSFHGRRVELGGNSSGSGSGGGAGAEVKHQHARASSSTTMSVSGMDPSREGNIDRLLDRMSDPLSSEEDEVPLSYGPRAVGRV